MRITQRDPLNHILRELVKALGVTTDQLLGVKEIKETTKRKVNLLWWLFSQAERKVDHPDPRRILRQGKIKKGHRLDALGGVK